jgi:ubiquinone/menaquinone biosynthesis C-methylase UbiE
MNKSYISVTEIANESISSEQLKRLHHRYCWAKNYCVGKDVLEVACGSGPGLHLLNEVAKTLSAGDIDQNIVNVTKKNFNNSFEIKKFDALSMPYKDNSKDVIIIFEAIYYLSNFKKFINECNRVLRINGVILIATANKDLFDFNPSPISYEYFGVKELKEKLSNTGSLSFYGFLSINEISLFQKILRPIKKIASILGIFPKTMSGKKILKRLIFGKLIKMPKWLNGDEYIYNPPEILDDNIKNINHKVIYCVYKKK